MKKIMYLCAALALVLTGCETYIVPGDKADLSQLAPATIREGFSTKPSDPFPASIVAVRLQAAGYSNYRLQQGAGIYGSGGFSVVTTREVESDSDFSRILELPGVERLIALNRMLIPERLVGLQQLREAASKLKADLMFVYTFDTVFFDANKSKVVSAITLGFSPNKRIRATTTVSGLLIDTRTGYVYSAYETTASEEQSASVWNTQDTADKSRLTTEEKAFEKLINQVINSWPELLSGVENRKS